MGFETVMAPCNGCYHNLKKAEYDLANDADLVLLGAGPQGLSAAV